MFFFGNNNYFKKNLAEIIHKNQTVIIIIKTISRISIEARD